MFSHLPTLLAACSGIANAASHPRTNNGLVWTENAVRMNQIQVLGSHNSYHREGTPEEQQVLPKYRPDARNLIYSQPTMEIQAKYQHIRSFEIDVFADPEGGNFAKPMIRAQFQSGELPGLDAPGVKVLHLPDLDYHVSCKTLKECITQLKEWSDSKPHHVPIPVVLEFKTAEPELVGKGGTKVIPWDKEELVKGLEDEITSILDKSKIITPDDIRQPDLTLEKSILTHGWPDLDSARGRFMFFMDDNQAPGLRDLYIKDRPSLEGRLLFTQTTPGQPDCAFQKLYDPRGDGLANIQKQVKAGYWVRTRADIPIDTLLSNDVTGMREDAFASGAQIITTDFQVYGMSSRHSVDYQVQFEHHASSRCNPVLPNKACNDEKHREQEH